MVELRQRWHELVAKLDGERERKVIAFSAAILLLLLGAGPAAFGAVSKTISALPKKYATPVPAAPSIFFATPPEEGTSSPKPTMRASAPADDRTATLDPVVLPALQFLFPNAGDEVASPTTFAMRMESATAVAMLLEIANAAGERIDARPASPSSSGEWSVLLSLEPGEYVASARASLDDGSVVAFKERRAFRVLAAEMPRVPANPFEPSVELLAPDAKNGTYERIAPLAARVKNAEPSSLVFIVTDLGGNETIVLGSEAGVSGYWIALFEGAGGAYRARARAVIGDHESFSEESEFSLQAEPPQDKTS